METNGSLAGFQISERPFEEDEVLAITQQFCNCWSGAA
jgi:hypothetical protein